MPIYEKQQIIGLLSIIIIAGSATTGVILLKNLQDDQGASSVVSSSASTTNSGNEAAGTSSSSSASSTVTDATTASSVSSGYKDGTYTETGSFYTPDGTESMDVTITLADGLITDVSLDYSSIYNRESYMYTNMFSQNIDSYAVGQSIDGLSLRRVAGASLTTDGFNNALEIIRSDAAA